MSRGRKPRAFSKYMNCVSKMPPLKLVYDGYDKNEEFDFNKSPMVQWVMNQADVRQYLLTYIKQSGLIRYDSDLKLWIGVDYFNPETE